MSVPDTLPAGDDRASVFGPERRALTVGLLLAIGAFAIEGMGVVPALPTAVRELGGLSLFGWSFSGFMLAWLVGSVWAGALADARGPRRPMAIGLLCFGAGLLLAASARGMPQFLVGRGLQGAGGGAMLAAAYVAIARGYPDAVRSRMIALTASVWILPALVGPAASGMITEWASWRLVFAGIAPIIALIAVLVLRPLRPFDLHLPPAPSGRVLSSLRLALGSGFILAAPSLRGVDFGVLRGALASFAAPLSIAIAGVALLAPALRVLLPVGTLRARRGLPAGLAVRSLLSFAFFGTEAFIPLAASQLRGASPASAALTLTAGAFGWVSVSWLQDRIEARDGGGGRALRVRVGFVLLTCAIALVSAALLSSLPVVFVAAAWALGGAACGLAYSAGGLLCLAAAPKGSEGEVSGQLQIAECLGTSSGTGLGGALLAGFADAARSPRESHVVVFAITIVAALVGIAIAGRAGATGAVRTR